MRSSLLCLLVLLAGCPGSLKTDALEGGDDSDGNGAGAGNSPTECRVANDCVAAGPKCCDCPTHAVPKADPTQAACAAVDCAPTQCGSPMEAACNAGRCDLVCSPVQCDANISCAYGLATDGNGCLTCACADAPQSAQCSLDTDCARVKDDCCGCAMGGEDTAIPAGQVAAHDAALSCSANPSCPGFNACAPDMQARCVQGECALVTGVIPPNACGRADLAACGAGESCTVNANDQATMYGVGVCQP
ncbi:MAG TPA: hypothetical protein VMZ53_01255 [Kofleriaceae bacterium]|nr:hypothetical protein [Kofleriaceae bacterium]